MIKPIFKNTAGRALYRQLAELLRSEIENGDRLANEMLPSERDLAIKYDMSRDTVRKAVRLLETQGILYSEQGRGTFVSPAQVREMSRFLDSFSVDTVKRGGMPGQKILLVEQIPASLAVAGVLEIEPRRMITRVKRIRTVDAMQVGFHDSYLVLPGIITEGELLNTGSLYALLAERFDLHAAEGLESIGSIAAGVEDSMLLGVAIGAPLLLSERITLSDRRQPFEYCEMRYVSSYRYTMRVNRSDHITK